MNGSRCDHERGTAPPKTAASLGDRGVLQENFRFFDDEPVPYSFGPAFVYSGAGLDEGRRGRRLMVDPQKTASGQTRRVGLFAMVVVAAVLVTARSAAAQPMGAVQGTVVDQASGAPLDSAVVTLAEVGQSATTGPDGTFAFDGVPVGEYQLTVTRTGFAPVTSPVTVTAGDQVRLDVRLPAAGFEERVTVAGIRRPLALTDQSDTGSRLGLRAIDIPASIDMVDSSAMETPWLSTAERRGRDVSRCRVWS